MKHVLFELIIEMLKLSKPTKNSTSKTMKPTDLNQHLTEIASNPDPVERYNQFLNLFSSEMDLDDDEIENAIEALPDEARAIFNGYQDALFGGDVLGGLQG